MRTAVSEGEIEGAVANREELLLPFMTPQRAGFQKGAIWCIKKKRVEFLLSVMFFERRDCGSKKNGKVNLVGPLKKNETRYTTFYKIKLCLDEGNALPKHLM